MGIGDMPDVLYVKRWEKGIPNYRVGHLAKMETLFSKLKEHKGLYLSSNAYFGVGLNDCVGNSKKVATQVLEEM